MIPSYFYPEPKDPQERKDYWVDWSDQLGDGETIVASTWSLAGLTVEDEGITASVETQKAAAVAGILVSGGVDGTDVEALNHVTLSSGREYERTAVIAVRHL